MKRFDLNGKVVFITCAPQFLDPGHTDPVAGPSASCGMIVA
jgi:hypothetical protein